MKVRRIASGSYVSADGLYAFVRDPLQRCWYVYDNVESPERFPLSLHSNWMWPTLAEAKAAADEGMDD